MMKKTPSGKTTGKRDADPHRDREASRYDEPLPSREYILEVLAEEGVPMNERALAKLLGVGEEEMDGFHRRLGAMERDGQILRNRKDAILVAGKLDLIAGRIEGHPDGFGFLVPDAPTPDGDDSDLYVGPREMRKVFHGDRVMGRAGGLDRRGRREASIVEVIARANATLVGRLQAERDVLYVRPSERKISQDILVSRADAGKAKPGEVVVVEIIEPPTDHSQAVGRVKEVLGNATDPGIEIEIALRKHRLPFEFSAAAIEQASRYPSEPRKSDWAGRIDLRDMALVTIDGETAKDFDDAVWCTKEGKGFRLVVAIADVSHYVRDGDPLDVEGRARGNSVYFPRRVIPMLPEHLSNGLCSINPDVERLCLVADMAISGQGDIKRYKFYPAVIRSKARLTYNKVWEALSNPKGDTARGMGALLPDLQNLHELFKVLLSARTRRGAIDFDTVETRFIFDDDGRIEKIVPSTRNDAHRIIEECMLAANVSASDFLVGNGHPTLFRVHEGPTPERLQVLREFLKGFGLHLQGGEKPSAKDYAKLVETIKTRPDFGLLQTVLLRSLQQAVYSPDNVGHFGLAYDGYAHFTSPIRRYPDLLVHRAIKAVLEGGQYKAGSWVELGKHCSMTERRADEATREVEQWLKCYYMRDREGEEFDGTISAVTGFGIFVGLDEFFVEGLVHVSELGSDYFQFDPARYEIRGERTGVRFRLADRVRVKIARVDLETSKMDFVLAKGFEPQRSSPLGGPSGSAAGSAGGAPAGRAAKPAAHAKAKPAAKATRKGRS